MCRGGSPHVRRTYVAGLALVATACSGAGPGPAAPAQQASARSGASVAGDPATEYPDLNTRRLRVLASDPRPVEQSALPPRHLDAETFPDTLVDRNLIVSGGPPPDGIPALDDPDLVPARAVDWLEADEAVLVLQVGPSVRAYPAQVMVWHEIVNDVVDGMPVTVTYCPLCNSGVAFDRRVDGRVLDFGTSGALYQSALVMYDRQTETLWTHFDGRAVVGTLVGSALDTLPVSTVSWREFRRAHPDAPVLSRDTGYERPYGRNPYVGYDQGDAPLTGFFSGDVDPRSAAMARVVGVHAGGDSLAVVTDRLADRGTVAAVLDGRPVVLWHLPGTASALDAPSVADGGDVGATGVFYADRLRDGRRAPGRFARDGTTFTDDGGTRWNVLGEAVAGPLAGAELEPVPHVDTFWFAWSTYRPDTRLRE